MDRCALKQTVRERERDHESIYTKTKSERERESMDRYALKETVREREIMDRYALKQTVRERDRGSICPKTNSKGEGERSWIDMH
jgi:hypothetical protein